MPKHRRRTYFIEKEFQIKFIGIIVLFMFIIAGFSAFTTYYCTWMVLGEKLANVYPQGRLVAILRKANFMFLTRVLMVTPLVIFLAMRLSHRIAGPIYRLKKSLKEVAEGNYGLRIRLRKTDELKDVAEAINKVVELLDKKGKEGQ